MSYDPVGIRIEDLPIQVYCVAATPHFHLKFNTTSACAIIYKV
jgi:hypothetical protein